MKYYLIAGEASGDLHGSNLMKGIKNVDPQCEFRFWGGDLMASVGGTLVKHYKESAVMGLVEVFAKLDKIRRNFEYCKEDLLTYRPDVVILIDYPGFNLKIAKFAKSHGIRVFYYIAPKLWARGEGRIVKIKKYVDELFIIFPFEIEYFHRLGVDAHYFGNPLIDSISQDKCSTESRDEFLRRTSLQDKPVIALLAGSREAEIKYLLPRFVILESLMKESKWTDYQLVLAAAKSIDRSIYRKYLPEDSKIKILYGETYSIVKQADAAIISSGTASLEAALIGTPQVVCYGFNEITYLLARLLVHVNYISLANLILDKLIFKELIQHDATPDKMLKELDKLVFDNKYRENMEEDYVRLKEVLGGGGASDKIASAMINILKSK
ncbi:MAG: lipid-A-disaccharide synthase [Bacteroidales bacterium]|nr:lipid-A-disaccharide synthase [Bacteroidales bacterium]MDD4670191.1 lipid-A-disaccharide synthase [Bacteroidales bacterium]